jgi:CRP/FNR family transcriptional regulator, cyclic AMP receptor protein
MSTRLHRRSSEVRLQQTTLLSATGNGSTTAPDVLGHLTEATHKAVLAIGRTRDYAIGELLFQQGDPHNGIYLISRGLVRSFYVSQDGRELTLGFWTAGHYVGAPQMFGGGQHAWASVATAPTSCLWLPGKSLRELAGQQVDLALTLMDALIHKSQCYCDLLQLLATQSMRVRLARLLNMLAAREDGADISLSHSQLASMIGSTRQWVSLTLSRFEAAGFIVKQAQGTIKVLAPDRLDSLS